jgi:phospholipase D1/2
MSYGSSGSPAWLWLHGDLNLTIHEARGLPNMDLLSTILRRLCLCPPLVGMTTPSTRPRSLPDDDDDRAHHRAHPHNHHLRGRLHRHHRRRHEPQPHGHLLLPTSDPYAAVVVAGPHETTVARTFVYRNSEAPKWEASFLLPLAHAATGLEFHVKDADPFGSDLIGVASLPAAAVLAAADAPIVSKWLDLNRPDGRRGPPKPGGGSAIRISATFVPAAAAASRQRSGGVPAYFPLRRGCDVRLYQDAHVAPGEVDGVAGPGFRPGRCWEDLCMAVLCAQRLVYVAGWSVHTRVRLLREAMSPEMAAKAAELEELGGEPVENMSLGELLKYKSQEGVRVLLLVWDDRTSHDNFFVKTVRLCSNSNSNHLKLYIYIYILDLGLV